MSKVVNIYLTRCWLNHFLIFFSVSESESGSKGKTQFERQDFTVGEHGMEYGEVKADTDSDTDSNPD
jgi:hypothetical protein